MFCVVFAVPAPHLVHGSATDYHKLVCRCCKIGRPKILERCPLCAYHLQLYVSILAESCAQFSLTHACVTQTYIRTYIHTYIHTYIWAQVRGKMSNPSQLRQQCQHGVLLEVQHVYAQAFGDGGRWVPAITKGISFSCRRLRQYSC